MKRGLITSTGGLNSRDKILVNVSIVMQNNKERIYYVYVYLDSNNIPIYVGKGYGNRADKHISIIKKKIEKNIKPKTHFYNHLSKAIKSGIQPKYFISQSNLTEEEAHNYEKYLIKLFGRKDRKTGILLNHTDGGEGSSGLKWSEESRNNKKGVNHPLYQKGYLVSGEKNAFFGKHHTEEWKKHHSKTIGNILKNSKKAHEFHESQKGKKYQRSEETKARISAAKKKFFENKINKEKNTIFFNFKGRRHSEETKKKMSEKRKAWYQNHRIVNEM